MKKILSVLKLALVAAVLVAVLPSVAADDVMPPWWSRTAEGTVTAEWSTWQNFRWNMPPDSWSYTPHPGQDLPNPPYADAPPDSQRIVENPPSNRIYIWQDAPITFWMPNFKNESELKHVWFQLTYSVPNAFQKPKFHVTTPTSNFNVLGPDAFVTRIDLDPLDIWYTDVFAFEIYPNPEWETIELSFYNENTGEPWYPAYVDQVVIDTWCVPEPATLSLLALGGLALLRRRKR